MKRENVICAVILMGLIVTALVAVLYDQEQPVQVTINEDATFSGNILHEGDSRIHSIRIYENVTSAHFVLLAYGKDYDLYGRLGEIPSISTYDFRGYSSGGEDLVYDYPELGIWHLMVHSYSGTGQYNLIIEFEYD